MPFKVKPTTSQREYDALAEEANAVIATRATADANPQHVTNTTYDICCNAFRTSDDFAERLASLQHAIAIICACN